MEEALKRKAITTLITAACTVPAVALAGGEGKPAGDSAYPEGNRLEKPMIAQAISQEVIQVLEKEWDPSSCGFNIAGRPGVHFRVYYSPSNKDKTYRLLPAGQGTIGENGMASLTLRLADLKTEEFYLRIFTSDRPDFSGEVRTMAEPMFLRRGESDPPESKMMDKSSLDTIIENFKRKTEVRTPSAVAAVRSLLPDPPSEDKY